MKTLSLIFIFTFFLNANCQDYSKSLQSKTWFVKDSQLKLESFLLNSKKPAGKSYEVKFFPNGNVQMPYYYDKSFKFICPYEIKNDTVKIYYTINYEKKNREEKITYYYKIKELANKKDLEFTAITAGNVNVK